MKKTIAILCLMLFTIQSAMAQRFTDKLDRGLVVVPTGSTDGSTTNFVSWRRLADEYYGVTYNLYKNGTRIATNLTTTSYNDNNNAPPTTQYQVAAVVNGADDDGMDGVRLQIRRQHTNGDRLHRHSTRHRLRPRQRCRDQPLRAQRCGAGRP